MPVYRLEGGVEILFQSFHVSGVGRFHPRHLLGGAEGLEDHAEEGDDPQGESDDCGVRDPDPSLCHVAQKPSDQNGGGRHPQVTSDAPRGARLGIVGAVALNQVVVGGDDLQGRVPLLPEQRGLPSALLDLLLQCLGKLLQLFRRRQIDQATANPPGKGLLQG